MVETGPPWLVVVLPAILLVLAGGAAAADTALSLRAAGGPVRATWVLGEAARLLTQQRRTTLAADRLLWRGGGVVLVVGALLAGLVLPLGRWSVADLSVGIVWFNAMEVLAWLGIWCVGWGANSAFSLVAGYRFVAQGLAYELPHMFALITAGLAAQSLQVGDAVEAQVSLWSVVWMPVAFVVYLLSVAGFAFWGPFASPTSMDVAGGVLAELSGADRLLVLVGRWLLLTVGAAMAVPLFLGGGNGPLLPDWLWALAKTVAVLAALVWLRRRVPVVRMERWTEVSWMVLVPASLLQALVATVVVLVR